MVKQPLSTPQFPLRPFAIVVILKLYLSSDNAIARSAILHKREHFQVRSLKKVESKAKHCTFTQRRFGRPENGCQ